MGLGPDYTKEEDEIINWHMRYVHRRKHKAVLARCRMISEKFLPHRSPEGIREHWLHPTKNSWENPIKDVVDLLDDRQRRKYSYTFPRIKKYDDPRLKGDKSE